MDRWTGEGKVKLLDDVMTLPALGRSFRLATAVHFTHKIDGSDTQSLVGRVKTDAQLAELGAEHYGASVILGESGYECEEGFIGTPVEDPTVGASGLLKLEQ
jgi:hypothetical protein